MKISIIILNWNQEADTAACLESLQRLKPSGQDIFLIDNNSVDGSPARLALRFPGVKMIRNRENLGFAEGCNIGIRAALKAGAELILLLNNDTTVEPDFLSHLAGAINGSAIVSPKIMFHSDQQKVWFAGGGFRSVIGKPYHLGYGESDRSTNGGPFETQWVSGCCMLVKREVFEKIGLLPNEYFNNYEDVDFCVQAKQAGYKIMVVPQAKIYHKFAASMGGKFSPFYTYFRTRNNLLFFKRTGRRLPLALNFVTFPFYSLAASMLKGDWKSMLATAVAVFDFLRGNYGFGSAKLFQK